MRLRVIIVPAAEADLVRAIEEYEALRPGYGEVLRLEIDRTIGLIQQWPCSYERVSRRLRRAVVHRFQFSIVYRPLATEIRVVGVVPTRRDPAILSERGRDVTG